jgi:membrane associated rhomboid family serine protease
LLITHFILIISIFLSLKAFNDKIFFYQLSFSPYEVKHNGKWFKVITHAFVHADFTHLIFNMFVLWQFGEAMEITMKNHFGVLGGIYFLLLYFGGILFSTFISFSRHQDNQSYVSVGASGAVSALIFAGIIMMPEMRLAPIFFPFPIPGFIFGFIYITAEIIMDKVGKTNIAHDAHLLGALFGILFISVLDIQILKDFLAFVKWYIS